MNEYRSEETINIRIFFQEIFYQADEAEIDKKKKEEQTPNIDINDNHKERSKKLRQSTILHKQSTNNDKNLRQSGLKGNNNSQPNMRKWSRSTRVPA